MMHFLCIGKRYALNKPIKYINYLTLYRQSSLVFLLICLFSFHFVCFAQESGESSSSGITLTGQVSSAADGKRLQGATITVGDKYTITDSKGEFSIQMPSNKGTLKVSHIGYQEQNINYNLESKYIYVKLNTLESEIQEVEVVSTGYQKIPRERATGSFEFIDNESFNKMHSTNILDRLDGVASGLQFDNRSSNPRIHIRGINSFSEGSSSKPLIVVDNFPFEGDLESINPNEVESISILKDAAATSIWGVRAGNGVIVISLKKPSINRLDINYSSNMSFIDKPNIYYHQPMSSKDFIEVERFLYTEGHYGDMKGARARTQVFSPVVTMLDAIDRGLSTFSVLEDSISFWGNIDYRDDLYKYFMKKGTNQQHNLSLSKSSNNNSFRLSLGFDNNKGGISKKEHKRYTIRSFNSFSFRQRFEIDANISASINEKNQSFGSVNYPIATGGGKSQLYPYARLLDESGNALAVPKDYFMNYIDTVGSGQLLDWYYRPYDEIDKSYSEDQIQHISLGVNFKAKLLNGLQTTVSYNFEKQNGSSEILRGEESYYARNLINRFTEITPIGLKYNIPIGGILSNSNSDLLSNRIRGQLELNRRLFTDFQVDAIIGSEISDSRTSSQSYGSYGFDRDTYTVKNVNYVDAFKLYDGLGSGRISSFDAVNLTVRRFASFYFNTNFSYKGRYVASFSARKDAANTFGIKTNERWNPLWSSGILWNINNESFMENITFISNLRFRATLGHSGNIGAGTSDRPILTHMSAIQQHNNFPYALINTLPNPSLKWENVMMRNYALESTFLNSKYGFTFEYYTKYVTDLISEDPIDPTSGYLTMQRNVGEIKSKGFDTQLNGNWKLNEYSSWQMKAGLSYIKDIVKVYKGTERTADNYLGGKRMSPLVDKVFYPLFSYSFYGLDPKTGDPLGYLNEEVSDDYTIMNRDSLKNVNYHGSTLPHWYGHIHNTFNYKGFSLYINMTYKFGHYFLKPTISYTDLFKSWLTHSDYEKRWQQSGDELITTVPSMVYPANTARDSFYKNSAANVERADHIRLKTVRFSYNLPVKTNSKYIKAAQLYFNANNLGLIWAATDSGIDSDYEGLPPTPDFNFGFTCRF